jgi:hypothetical protein
MDTKQTRDNIIWSTVFLIGSVAYVACFLQMARYVNSHTWAWNRGTAEACGVAAIICLTLISFAGRFWVPEALLPKSKTSNKALGNAMVIFSFVGAMAMPVILTSAGVPFPILSGQVMLWLIPIWYAVFMFRAHRMDKQLAAS